MFLEQVILPWANLFVCKTILIANILKKTNDVGKLNWLEQFSSRSIQVNVQVVFDYVLQTMIVIPVCFYFCRNASSSANP
jgi:hypothetical protein